MKVLTNTMKFCMFERRELKGAFRPKKQTGDKKQLRIDGVCNY